MADSDKEQIIFKDVETISQTSNESNPFVDPKLRKYYTDLYEKTNYECRGAFDPDFEWTPEEEKKIVRYLDFRVALLACFMFVALQVDRGNLKQAISDNMLNDLGMTTDQYNTGNTIFYVCFLLAELPSQLISKWVGPDRWIPMQMCMWSVVAMAQAGLKGQSSFYATRALIGILEGGFIPDLVLWLSYFYKGNELPIRLSWFWTTLALVTIFTSLLAFGLLRLRGVAGWAGWQWLFLIEGIFTFCIGVSSYFLMVPSASQTKSWWCPNGWFTEREEKIVVNRVLRDDPSKGDMHNREPITPKKLLQSILDYDLWPIYIIGLIAYVPMNQVTAYLTLTLKQLGWSTFDVNLLTIPYNVIQIILLLFTTWVTEKVNERSLVCLSYPIFASPLLIALRWWPGSMVNPWGTWIICTLILGAPYIHAICVAWVSRNSNAIRTRGVSSAVYNIFVQLGSVIGSNVYRKDDAPLYHRGNEVLFALCIIMIPILLGTKGYYMWRNKTKAAKWDVMSEDEKYDYLVNTKDEGSKRLDFRFSH